MPRASVGWILSCSVLCLLLIQSLGVRRQGANRAKRSPERVHQVVTYGAARPSWEAFQNPSSDDGCWSGYRFVNMDTWTIDPVPALGQAVWWHPSMTTVKLDWMSRIEGFGCGTNDFNLRVPSPWDHSLSEYYKRLQGRKESYEVTMNGIPIMYETNATKIKETLQDGWELQGSAFTTGDKCHLVQQADTGACIITFSGSDDWSDWYDTNLAGRHVEFCNFENNWVHNGFMSELMAIVQSTDYLTNIKPKLSSCSHITAAGHSMGGAVATLFAGCANNELRASTDANFTALKWW